MKLTLFHDLHLIMRLSIPATTSIIGVKNIKKMNLESFEAVLDELSANMDDGDDDEDVEGMESEDIDDIDSNQS